MSLLSWLRGRGRRNRRARRRGTSAVIPVPLTWMLLSPLAHGVLPCFELGCTIGRNLVAVGDDAVAPCFRITSARAQCFHLLAAFG